MNRRLRKLCEQHDWRCMLCGKPIPRDFTPGSPMAPSRDHVVPRRINSKLERPKGHNSQPAHAWCNSKRGDRPLKDCRPGFFDGLEKAQRRFLLDSVKASI